MTRPVLLAVLALVLAWPVQSQPADDTLARIRAEGLERSQVMRLMHVLTDVYGPRLTGSPSLERAGEWALEQMTAWGLEEARAEPWDWGHPGWVNERFSAHIVAPVQDQLTCEVLAWTPGTDSVVTAGAVYLTPPQNPTQTQLTAYLDSVQAHVAGKIVLVGEVEAAPMAFELPRRRDDDEMRQEYEPDNPAEARDYRRPEQAEGALSTREVNAQLDAFLLGEGVPVRVNPARMDNGLIRAFANASYDPATAVPTVVMRNEDYGRIVRLLAAEMPVALSFEVVNRLYPEGRTAYNYIAEIPGTERPEEVVMLGAHLDSWHAATGATDNAAGSAVMMEAVRILQALGLKPRRTIRVALWTGEEQGLLGSQAYVAEHFGTFEDPKPGYETFGGYVNLDMGTGRVRGATVFGPRAAAAVLEEILAPFDDLGVAGARPSFSRGLGGSDHTSFNQAGLPGISLGQDPIEYFTLTWHTNLDTYERILDEDLQQAAVVTAAAVYQLAMQDALLPRFSGEEMPATPPARSR